MYTTVNARGAVTYGEGPISRAAGLVFWNNSDYEIDPEIKCCPCCALIWVHGIDNDLAEAKRGFESVEKAHQKAGGKCEVFGFAWQSGDWTNFGSAETAADYVGKGPLAKFVRDLKAKCPKTRINFGAHSLGSRVVLRALQEDNNGVSGIGMVALASAAVDNEALGDGEEFGRAKKWAESIYVAHNIQDPALKVYLARKMDKALGYSGEEDEVEGDNVTSHDYSNQWGGNHGAVYNEKLNAGFWEAVSGPMNGQCK